ncbi:SDR family oxidoreductase [Rugosimonospora acidiphila]|uniref:SDR family oxidoreductase n=1 Tax=Rugosimonospora acidiphila TaxID=556531 RepID=UPI0031EB419D
MTLSGAVVVVTGGASGIGAALARRFAAEGARAVVVADLDAAGAEAVAGGLDCPVRLGVGLDVADEEQVAALAARVAEQLGPIDLYCSNAGVAGSPGLGTDQDWARAFGVNVLAHLYVARHVVPAMVARGSGHLLITASAAGLLAEADLAAYSVTKHGSVALAEWLAIQHAEAGVGFSCLCPQAVNTPMLARAPGESTTRAAGAALEPEQVCDSVIEALAAGRFLILPHAAVHEYERQRAADRDRWLSGVRRLRARARGASTATD